VVRRLSRAEYNNTVRDLLNDATRPADSFLVDERKLGFDNIAEVQTASPVRAEQYMLASEKLVEQAVSSLVASLPCAATADAACAGQLIREFGQKAYRRPLSDVEVTRLLGVFQVGNDGGGFQRGIGLALRTMLISPSFLFRVELGEPVANTPGLLRPTSWEMASRLSYLILGTLPDAELFTAASQNALSSKEQVRAQAERLMGDARAKANITHLHSQWFDLASIDPVHIKKDAALFPKFSDELLFLARKETETFLNDLVWNSQEGAKALLTGSYSFVNAKLAAFYGVTGPSTENFERVALDPTRRSGILTQVGILARLAHAEQTSPTLRGKFVRERFLCTTIPPPPPTVNATLQPPQAASTTRARLAQHLVDPTCAGCHNLIDPIGLGFEHYDATGAWQEQEGGQAVDASGFVTGVTFDAPYDGTFNGVPALAVQLAESPEVQACITKQWFRFAYGREETPLDEAVLSQLQTGLEGSGGNLRELLLLLTQTDAFMYRGPQGETL